MHLPGGPRNIWILIRIETSSLLFCHLHWHQVIHLVVSPWLIPSSSASSCSISRSSRPERCGETFERRVYHRVSWGVSCWEVVLYVETWLKHVKNRVSVLALLRLWRNQIEIDWIIDVMNQWYSQSGKACHMVFERVWGSNSTVDALICKLCHSLSDWLSNIHLWAAWIRLS